MPGHYGIPGNEEADTLARQASAMPLHGPEPAFGIPRRSATEAIKNWTEYQHYSAWKDLPGYDMANFLLVDHARGELKTCLN
jgi:hypothetical protein